MRYFGRVLAVLALAASLCLTLIITIPAHAQASVVDAVARAVAGPA